MMFPFEDIAFEVVSVKDNVNFANTREEFNYLHFEIFHSLYLDFFVELSLHSDIHDSHVMTPLWSDFVLVQNDD